MALLMQRLRTLQLRLNSVDATSAKAAGERVLEWRAFLGETKAREKRRRRLYAHVVDSAKAVTADFEHRFESGFLRRLSESFHTLEPAIEGRASVLAGSRAFDLEDEFGGRLNALERRSAAADAQLAELRAACGETYEKFAEANARLDEIWANDDTEGVGGWRQMLRKVNLEREASLKTPLQAFREDAYGDGEDLDGPDAIGLTCPMCLDKTGRRRPRTGVTDDVLGLIGIAPFRCPRCMVRFYRFRPGKRRSN
jgi:hypothetical protein